MKGPSKLQVILLHVGLTVLCIATLYPVLWVEDIRRLAALDIP